MKRVEGGMDAAIDQAKVCGGEIVRWVKNTLHECVFPVRSWKGFLAGLAFVMQWRSCSAISLIEI